MKSLILFVFFITTSCQLMAQDISGEWNGELEIPSGKLKIIFTLTRQPTAWNATMSSPSQGAFNIPTSSTSFVDKNLEIKISTLSISYEGKLVNDSLIQGFFKQSGLELPLELKHKNDKVKEIDRPQEPKPPFSYISDEVKIFNAQGKDTIAGTLTLPGNDGPYPVVVLISGSGPQDRNEEILGHKPFLVIADYFTRNGIAVLRYDDRGVAKSTGNFATATTADFATDASAVVDYLKTRKEIDKKSIGLIGHSEGGVIAPMVAADRNDISFIVLLAGTGLRGDKLLLLQQELIGRVQGMSGKALEESAAANKGAFALVQKYKDSAVLRKAMQDYITALEEKENYSTLPKGMEKTAFVNKQVDRILSPWMLYFLKLDPAIALQKVKCPVLAVNGTSDLQVPAKENLEAIKNALEKGGNKKLTLKEFPGLNHLFQHSETGNPADYASIKETFSAEAMEQILNWIKQQIK